MQFCMHACIGVLVCSCYRGFFQASLPLPVKSVKNSQEEDKGCLVESRAGSGEATVQGMEG